MPVATKPHAERAARRIASDPAYDLWEEHFSPNGRRIAFTVERFQPGGAESTIYVMSATGGPWIRITEGKHWDDKLERHSVNTLQNLVMQTWPGEHGVS